MFSPWAKTTSQIKLSYFVEGVEREVLHDKDDVLVHCDAPHPPPLHIHRHLSVSDKKICIRQKICNRQKEICIAKKNLYPPKKAIVKVYGAFL